MISTYPAETSAKLPSCYLHGAKPLLRTRDVLAYLPFGKSKLYEEIHAGRFVAPLKTSSRMALYRREDVEAYLGRLMEVVVSGAAAEPSGVRDE